MKSNRMAYQLFSAQLIAHLSIIPMILYAEGIHYLLSLCIYFLTGCLGMSMTFHRLVAHQSWKAPKWFEAIGLAFATLGLTGSSIAWCAVHRDHHQNSDNSHDPHAPRHQGFFRVQFLSMFARTKMSLIRSLAKNPLNRFFHRYYWHLNLGFALLLFLIEPFAVIYLYLFPAAVLWNMGSFINTFGHKFGFKSFDTGDESKNNILLGLLMFGEGWHNNHHRYPKSSQFGQGYLQLDVSGKLIKLIEEKA